jgi:hypothetical protein
MDYFEQYYEYLCWCEKDNCANMRDPNHDYMEWNHTLPRCLFDDLPFGQWLTIEQHAIASALQTLAFNKSCVCGFQKNRMPEWLWNLVVPLYAENCRKTAIKSSPIMTMSSNDRRKNGEKGRASQKAQGTQSNPEVNARRSLSLKKTLSKPEVRARKSEAMRGEKNPMFGKTGGLSPVSGLTRSQEIRDKVSSSKTGTKRWVNSKGKWVYRRECPGPDWKLAKPNQ